MNFQGREGGADNGLASLARRWSRSRFIWELAKIGEISPSSSKSFGIKVNYISWQAH